MVEGARLERVCTRNRTEGSNPSLSARKKLELFPKPFRLEMTNLPLLGAFLLLLGA